MAGFRIESKHAIADLQFNCPPSGRTETLWALDLTLRPVNATWARTESSVEAPRLNSDQNPGEEFLRSSMDGMSLARSTDYLSVRFLLPSASGTVMRSDFVEHRFQCCRHATKSASFLSPLQTVDICPLQDITSASLITFLSHAVGAIILSKTSTFAHLDTEVANRLSFPWLSAAPIRPCRLAWIQGREDYECLEQILKAAAGLGIKLVVMDEPGHWLQSNDSPWTSLREAFVELDISPDEDLPNRVISAVRAYPDPIDGVVTISDVRLAGIARACKVLGFPTEDPLAYDIAGNKGKTRLLEPVGADESFVLSSADELETVLARRRCDELPPLNFPLIVKPVVGWCSDCVSKVSNEAELTKAVQKASDRHLNSPKKSTGVVVEPYVDGPEVDVNFILANDEILFCDVNDDFPSAGDAEGANSQANFQETQNVLPSALPPNEIKALHNQLRESVLRQGFHSGVFHCEARVRNSSMKYTRAATKGDDEGPIDLYPKNDDKSTTTSTPEVYLHEVNARPPGDLESAAVMLTYGVDYYAIRMLLALGPSHDVRMRALSQPFLNGAQFHLSVMIIQQTKAGIMRSPDAAREFLEKNAHLHDKVVDYYSRKKGGDVLEGPNAPSLWWLAFFSVVSRESRMDLLERVAYIEANFVYQMDELP